MAQLASTAVERRSWGLLVRKQSGFPSPGHRCVAITARVSPAHDDS